MPRRRPQAHELVVHAVVGLVERIRGAAARVMAPGFDAEAVHDFRVGMRRTRSVLRSAERLHGKKVLRPLGETLKRYGQATNALREAEVLGESLEGVAMKRSSRTALEGWLDAMASEQRAMRRDVRKLLEQPALEEMLEAIEATVGRKPKRVMSLDEFARDQLRRTRKGVRELLPVSREDVEQLHRLRIRFKRLRYTSEMLGQFIGLADAAASLTARKSDPGVTNYAAVARLAARMQKDLGRLHDADEALDTVAASSLDDAVKKDVLRGLRKRRTQLVDSALEHLDEMPPQLLWGRKALTK